MTGAAATGSEVHRAPKGRRGVLLGWSCCFAFCILYGIDPIHVTRYLCGPYLLPEAACAIDFWKRWELAALAATFFYALIFYLIGFCVTDPQYGRTQKGEERSLFGTIVEQGASRGTRRVFAVAICMGGAVLFIALATGFSLVDWPYLLGSRPYLLQLLCLLIACLFFLRISWIMKEKSEEEPVRTQFARSYRYNDWPVTIGFTVLFLFAGFFSYYEESHHARFTADAHREYFKAFVGGAVAFQMLVSNWIFTSVFGDHGLTNSGTGGVNAQAGG